MTPEQRAIVKTTGTIAGAFFLVIVAVCWVVATLAGALAEWMTR